jgi:hypothetical protein
MIRFGVAMWVGVIAVAAAAAFGISFEVQSLRERLSSLNRDIASEEDTIRVLKAEWAYMTQPTRLREMAHDYTALAPILPGQMLEDAAALPMPLRSPDAAPVNGAPGGDGPQVALAPMADVAGFGRAPLPARPGVPRTGALPDTALPDTALPDSALPDSAPAASAPAGGGYAAPPPVVAATEAAPRRATTPASPPAAAPAPRATPSAPPATAEDDPIAALLVSFQKEP